MKNLEKRERAWAYPWMAQIFSVPHSGTGKTTNFKFGRYIHRVHLNKSPLKSVIKGSVGVSRDCPHFWVPPIISGTGKATNFKFGTYIHRVHPNKRPLKIWEKRERRRIQGLPQFWSTPYYLRNGKATNFKCGRYIHRVKQKLIKNLGEKGAWTYSMTARIF